MIEIVLPFQSGNLAAMDQAALGFRLDGNFHPWGTRFDTVVSDFEGTGYASRMLPCDEVHGFATRYVELSAPRPDRPVMALAYELAGTDMRVNDILAQLVIRLGPPTDIDRDELSPYASTSDHVVLYASWKAREGISFGVSLYGAPRSSSFGDGVGKLYVNWNDVTAAAAPWMSAWRAANEEVASHALGATSVEFFAVNYDTCANYAGEPDRAAMLCLHAPEILDSPGPVAVELDDKRFALWTDRTGSRWYLSSLIDTIRLGERETSRVTVAHAAPARGGGSSAIEIGPWWVRDEWNSPTILNAVRRLQRVPGLTFHQSSGHDV